MIDMAFSDKLKKLREDKKMTQKELANKLDVTPRIISYYETGKSIPSDPELLHKIVSLFNVTLDYLLLDSMSATDFKFHNLVERLILDTKYTNITWVKFSTASWSYSSGGDYPEYIDIYDYFDLKNFHQYELFKCLHDKSYYTFIDSDSPNGYLLAFLKSFDSKETTIGLFAYVKYKFKFIADMNKLENIEDLYILVDSPDTELDEFIDEYLNDHIF